jgi:hypothetical protein
MFQPDTLQFIATLPRPHALGFDIAASSTIGYALILIMKEVKFRELYIQTLSLVALTNLERN